MVENDIRVVLGTVIGVYRGRADGTLSNDLVSLVVEADAATSTVDLPIPTRTSLELIPYQLAFQGACVKYQQTFEHHDDGAAESWKLEILSGPLGGQRYGSQD